MKITLQPKYSFSVPVDAGNITPNIFLGKSINEIKALHVWEGNCKRVLGDLFDVNYEAEESSENVKKKSMNIQFIGDLTKVKRIGAKMSLGRIDIEGNVGVASRSGTLTYEIVNSLSEKKMGQSTCVGLGGDPIIGTSFIDALDAFERDKETKAVVLVGEIGGSAEEDAAEHIIEHIDKPVFAFIAGRTAPPGKRMGHAGAIIARGKGTAKSKIKAFEKADVKIAQFPTDIADLVENQL